MPEVAPESPGKSCRSLGSEPHALVYFPLNISHQLTLSSLYTAQIHPGLLL